jgi:gamma-glutamylcyclotransferase (GGCT)/AIG2-like uncharacterized protein YtfP/GNAT superfamily N-acetyltransferase
MLGAMVAQGNAALTPAEWEKSHRIDRLLNFLEHICYLSRNGHSRWRDCEAYFGYWLSLPCDPERGALRRYLVHFGYEHLARWAHVTNEEYVLVYGTLLSAEGESDEARRLSDLLEFVETRQIRGRLYDLGDYPGFIPDDANGTNTVTARLCRIRDPKSLSQLDKYEEYDRLDLKRSLYRRTTLQLPKYLGRFAQRIRRRPMIDAWIYVYNQPIESYPVIESGSWAEHRKERKQNALRVRELGRGEENAFKALMSIYDASIVATERKTEAELRSMWQREGYAFLLAESGSNAIGFAIVYASQAGGCALLEYMAVDKAQRSQGVGRALFQRCVQIAGPGASLLLEVDALEPDAPNPEERAARQRFYRRVGCLALAGLKYLLPLAVNGQPPPMDLFVYAAPGAQVRRTVLSAWLSALYVEVYGQDPADARLASMTANLPEQVDLR